jgi:aconitase A
MAPEYGATMGFFPVDDNTLAYLRGTGRDEEEIGAFAAYFQAQQGLFGMPKRGEIDYSRTLALDLATVAPSLAGPKRPQDRVEIGAVKQSLHPAPRRAGRQERLRKKVGLPGTAMPDARRHRHRPRRRADRRHHLLHQHLQPERDARRRPAGEEGRRSAASRWPRTSRPRSPPARGWSPNT